MLSNDPTLYFARVLGPFVLAVAAAVALNADGMIALATAFFADAPLVFVTGALTMILGLAILAAHWRWDGIAAIIVSVFGLAAALRGALLLIAPAMAARLVEGIVRVPGIVFLPAAFAAIVGLYLCFAGWFAKRNAA